jgi:hypothetical protein
MYEMVRKPRTPSGKHFVLVAVLKPRYIDFITKIPNPYTIKTAQLYAVLLSSQLQYSNITCLLLNFCRRNARRFSTKTMQILSVPKYHGLEHTLPQNIQFLTTGNVT